MVGFYLVKRKCQNQKEYFRSNRNNKEYGLDPLRYYLIKEVSFGNDGNISQERLEDCINSDLANNFGNLCQRVTTFGIKNCNGKVPNNTEFTDEDIKILDNFKINLNVIGKNRQTRY